MKTVDKAFFLVMLTLLFPMFLWSCSKNQEFDSQNQILVEQHVIYNDLSDFLTPEQIALYNKAKVLFPLFHGHPDDIDILHLKLQNAAADEITAFSAELSSQRENSNYVIDGYQCSQKINDINYVLCMGAFQSIDSLKTLCLSVFADEYWNQLNCNDGPQNSIPQFLEIDGRMYYNSISIGGTFGYNPSEFPDKYELTSVSDTEICFNVIGHYKSSNVDADFTVDTQSFPVKLVLTDDGWRFSLFNTATT